MKTTNSTSVKVKNVILHNGVSVCKGKLVLIKSGLDKDSIHLSDKRNGFEGHYKPFIISEKEIILDADLYLSAYSFPQIQKHKETDIRLFEDCKIIVSPENFSVEQLHDIIDGKFKDGDEVFVECEWYNDSPMHRVMQIKLNKDNRINLFPVEKKEGWDEIIEHYEMNMMDGRALKHLIDNYNPPTRKDNKR